MLCNDISMNLPRFNSCVGSELKPVYHTKIKKDGTLELEITGYQNIQDQIEAERPGTELSVLISRYENGDLLALNSRPGFYGDLTKFPASPIDAMNLVHDAEVEFNGLPADIKQKFGSDWRRWLAECNTKEWSEVMAKFYNPKTEETVKKESETDAVE